MPIKILPEYIASQIAAGEVIERPASVVKELVENAIDANAKHIVIKITGSGQKSIEVSDDGIGIPSNELSLAVSKHATSKLFRSEDLFDIKTLGFRGEALASIGSISRLILTSYNGDDKTGTRIIVEGGNLQKLQPVGVPRGTVVLVEDLFFNVPARLKFLKSPSTEKRHIASLVTKYALAYPQIKWDFTQDGKSILQTSGNGNRREILIALYGTDEGNKLLDVEFLDDQLHIAGFISPLSLTRSNRRDITIFVNGRWVQDPSLTAAVIKAYHTMLMVGRYPIAIIFITMPTCLVDVNVHPAKAEVRFSNYDYIFSQLQRCVRRGLLSYSPIPSFKPSNLWGQHVHKVDPAWDMSQNLQEDKQLQLHTESGQSINKELLPKGSLPLLRVIGQVAATYIVAEGPDGLYLIDQHAAHERILFEKLMREYDSKTIVSQSLTEAAIVQLTPEKSVLLDEQLEYLINLGFVVEPFGNDTYKIRSVPTILQGGDPGIALIGLIEDFEEDETPLQNTIEAKIAGRVCKRMAVKGGQVLSEEEQISLLRDLENCESPRTCPHGRPTMIHLSADLLERQFGRTGSV